MLTGFLIRRTIPRSGETGDPAVRSAYGRLEAWVSIILNFLLFVTKLVLGIIINSLALIADAVHTLSDVATSGVVLVAARIANKPADQEHPFGHGRAEYIATLIIAIMLGVIGFEFMKSGAGRLINPVPVHAGWGILAAVSLTIVIKEWMGRFSAFLGKEIGSSTLQADAWHHRSDAISSILVLVAIGGSSLGYPILDGIGGIVVGGFLIWSGFAIAKAVVDPLMGEPPSPALIQRIRNICRSVEDVVDAHDITVHKYGYRMFLGVHVEISARLSAGEAHDIAEFVTDRLKRELAADFPGGEAYATVHVDPIDSEGELVQNVRRTLASLQSQSPLLTGFHDLRVVDTPEHRIILFDVDVIDEAGEKDRLVTRQWLSTQLKSHYPGTEIEITVSPHHTYR